MNQQLTLTQIRVTYRELAQESASVSGRQLRRELERRFGAVGKTARVFRVWKEERERTLAAHRPAPSDAEELAERLTQAEARAAAMQERAELAEYREQAHQDRLAMEIDGLRQRLRSQEAQAAEIRHLQERVLQLSRELMAARS
jgi:hypothetical protein